MRQIQRKFLLGSRWTAVVPLDEADRARHFEVIACTGELVTLRALLGGGLELPLCALDDPARWAPGWRSLPDP